MQPKPFQKSSRAVFTASESKEGSTTDHWLENQVPTWDNDGHGDTKETEQGR